MADETKSAVSDSPPSVIGGPTVAKVWDALLGGKDNWAGDRELVSRARSIDSEVAGLAGAIHDFRRRAVAQLAGPGRIDQFIECGPGLPTSDHNTRDVVQKINPVALRALRGSRSPRRLTRPRAHGDQRARPSDRCGSAGRRGRA
ncbi:SAM-dependent methyltransferase [Kribbella sp. NPDC023972]|uniref:SAM-dependent methyltransferase n=1 Tax=Kribbella sp. NPDC023972 TaxID=3154795 RepID=UPI0033C9C066